MDEAGRRMSSLIGLITPRRDNTPPPSFLDLRSFATKPSIRPNSVENPENISPDFRMSVLSVKSSDWISVIIFSISSTVVSINLRFAFESNCTHLSRVWTGVGYS